MKKNVTLLLLGLLSLSCSKSTPETYESYIRSFRILPTDNVLRFKAEILMEKDCNPLFEVRKKGTDHWTAMPGTTAILLYPETEYEGRVRINDLTGEPQPFTTGAIPEEVPVYTLKVDNGGPSDGYLIQTKESAPGFITVCDMQGQVVWYERFEDEGVRCVYYDPQQGKMAVLAGHKDEEATTEMHRPRYGQHIYVIDLEGNRLSAFPTTADHTQYPHHEIKLMPDGNILTVEAVIEYFDLSNIGGDSHADVWGDGYVVLTPEGRRVKDWSLFPELKLMENLSWLNPRLYQYDLVHANSVSWDENGDFYMTFHYISEIWKINGKTGEVEYRLGEHGNLKLDVPFAKGGFHAVVPLGPDRFLVNNNGASYGDPTNAQIYEVDTSSMTAHRIMNVAPPIEYTSTTGGNVEILPDGKTVFFDFTQVRSAVFTDMKGNLLKVFTRKDTSYRAFYFERIL